MNKPEIEKHERQFTGTNAPVELHDAVENGLISPTAAWLAMVINSLGKGKLKKCFASNKYLGGKIHRKERNIQYLLANLKKYGFLEIIEEKNGNRKSRILITIYENVNNNSHSTPRRVDSSNTKNNEGCKKLHGGDAKNCTHSINSISKKEINKEKCVSNGNSNFEFGTNRKVLDNTDIKLINKFKEIFKLNNLKLTGTVNRGIEELRKLRKRDSNMELTINWYLDNINNKEYKFPNIGSIKHFAMDKVYTWIKNIMDKHNVNTSMDINVDILPVDVNTRPRFARTGDINSTKEENIPITVNAIKKSKRPED